MRALGVCSSRNTLDRISVSQANSMELVDRIGVDAHRQQLVEAVLDHSALDASGLYVILDANDYFDYPTLLYRRGAFYLDVANGDLEEKSPEHVLAIMETPQCQHLVWLSRRRAMEPPAQFVWVFAHELQHMRQSVAGRSTLELGHFLGVAYPKVDPTPKTQLEIPTESDAELAARDSVREILGDEALRAYLQQADKDEAGRAYFRRFREIEDQWSGDLRQETLALFHRHEQTFAEFGRLNGYLDLPVNN